MTKIHQKAVAAKKVIRRIQRDLSTKGSTLAQTKVCVTCLPHCIEVCAACLHRCIQGGEVAAQEDLGEQANLYRRPRIIDIDQMTNSIIVMTVSIAAIIQTSQKVIDRLVALVAQ